MALSRAERRTLDEIARRVAAEDPEYARRLSAFGGHEAGALGLPARRSLLPVVLVGVLLAVSFAAFAVATARRDGGEPARRAPHVLLRP
ncbi:DUF3040 domain-containing protein [Actinomadura kijaniata]|uniref:DUF3040 domain-containing protein n=1 Tax=Actinomadura kijaniata TaxID=46161 RepID=UPI00083219BE|nr:DUF3040 domain-containing protein [Actinomadura kijaniata]